MFDNLQEVYNTFADNGLNKALEETLHLFDLMTNGALQNIDLSKLGEENIDLEVISQKRKEGIPLEYIFGVATFYGRTFYCSPSTLIPRKETELLTKISLDKIKGKRSDSVNVVDMGTGCGNIAISIALSLKDANILASDLNESTIDIARKNVARYELQSRVKLFSGDLFISISENDYKEKIDVVVCNPPYIPTTSLSKMAPEIKNHEPREAFDAGPFGVNFFRRLIRESLVYLKPNGSLVFEIGEGQERLVTRIFNKIDAYQDIEYHRANDMVRVISAQKKS